MQGCIKVGQKQKRQVAPELKDKYENYVVMPPSDK